MRSVLSLALAASLLSLAACAPRMAKTHYTRWEEQFALRKQKQASKSMAPKATKMAAPNTPAPPPNFNTLTATPPIPTATASRTPIRATEPEDEGVY